jgi:molecular chaperone DnaK
MYKKEGGDQADAGKPNQKAKKDDDDVIDAEVE